MSDVTYCPPDSRKRFRWGNLRGADRRVRDYTHTLRRKQSKGGDVTPQGMRVCVGTDPDGRPVYRTRSPYAVGAEDAISKVSFPLWAVHASHGSAADGTPADPKDRLAREYKRGYNRGLREESERAKQRIVRAQILDKLGAEHYAYYKTLSKRKRAQYRRTYGIKTSLA